MRLDSVGIELVTSDLLNGMECQRISIIFPRKI